MQNQYIDIPFSIGETPEQIIDLSVATEVDSDPKEAAHKLLTLLDNKMKSSQNELYNVYEIVIPNIHKTHFMQKQQWPETNVLQQAYDTEYKATSQNIYNEYWIRNYYARLKNLPEDKITDRIDMAWQTYTSIFQLEVGRVNFHPIVLWDMIEGFLNYYFYYRTKKGTVNDEFFNSDETKKILNKLAKEIPDTFNAPALNTKQIAGYYALTALIIIAIHEKKYEEGIKLVSKLSLKEMSAYSKAFGALMSLFLSISFCYFMMEQYDKASKLCETITFFYQKNRKYYNKATCRQSVSHLNEKCVSLLCLTHIFLEEKPKTALMEIFKNASFKSKDRENREKVSDCFYKMKQNDVATFTRIFTLYSYEYHIWDLVQVGVERFKALKQVTLNTIIQNYQRIELSKISKILKLSEKEILERLNSFSVPDKGDCPWVNTVMNPIMKQTKKVQVQIQGDIAIFDSQIIDMNDSTREWQRYRQQISYLKEKIRGA